MSLHKLSARRFLRMRPDQHASGGERDLPEELRLLLGERDQLVPPRRSRQSKSRKRRTRKHWRSLQNSGN